MSDPFDPEAWPRSSGASSPRGNDDENVTGEDVDDDFNPFTTDGQGNDDYDASTFGTAPAWGDDDSGDPYGSWDDVATTANNTGAPASGNDFNYGENEDDADPWSNGAVANYGEDDEDDFSYESSSTGVATNFKDNGDNNEYRDEFDDYDDDFSAYEDDDDNFSDDYDDDDNFDDREPGDSGNGKRIVAVVGALVIAGLLGGGALLLLGGGNGDKSATPTTQKSATTQTQNTQKSSTTNSSTPANTGTSTPANNSGVQTPAPSDVTTTLDNALTAWGKFAVDGDLNDVKPYFVEDSKQYDRFKLDAASIASQPPGGPPITVKMASPQTFAGDDANTWLIRGNVSWTRSGEQPQNFNWEIRMVRASDKQPWQISSVRQY
jgi:hypothetical protein